MFRRYFDEQKGWEKLCGLKLAFKKEIVVYIVQNEAVDIFVELFKRVNFFGTSFLGHDHQKLRLSSINIPVHAFELFCSFSWIGSLQ